MKYNNILVAYDGSETSKIAIERAKAIAAQNEQAQVNVVYVIEFPAPMYEGYNYQNLMELNQVQAERTLKEAEELVKDLNNEKQFVILRGHVSTSVLDYAEEKNSDLILIGSRGLGGIQRFFLGSVSFHVVQKAKCDVLVVK